LQKPKKPLRDLEDEKRIVNLERELDDLRKNLDDKSERINFMQKEGRFHQERIVEMYQLEKANKQLKGEIQYLNDELDASKVSILSIYPFPYHPLHRESSKK